MTQLADSDEEPSRATTASAARKAAAAATSISRLTRLETNSTRVSAPIMVRPAKSQGGGAVGRDVNGSGGGDESGRNRGEGRGDARRRRAFRLKAGHYRWVGSRLCEPSSRSSAAWWRRAAAAAVAVDAAPLVVGIDTGGETRPTVGHSRTSVIQIAVSAAEMDANRQL